jgi:four helix bundle protein
MADFTKLQVWRLSRKLALAVRRATRIFPPDERERLGMDIRKSAVSIASKIAAASAMSSRQLRLKAFQRAMHYAIRLETYMITAHDLGYLSNDDYPELDEQLQEIMARLRHLIRRLRESIDR